MKYHFIIVLCLSCYLTALQAKPDSIQQSPTAQSEEEALFVRRIIEFWKDKENSILKTQIKQFLHAFPQSEFASSFQVILGDIHFQESNYPQALHYYQSLQNHPLEKKIWINLIHCLYATENFSSLLKLTETYFNNQFFQEEVKKKNLLHFYHAEACLALALDKQSPEKKNALLQRASLHYESIKDTEHQIHSLNALAKIFHLLKDYEKSTQYWLKLSQVHGEKKSEYLFQVGNMQAFYDKKKALSTYLKVMRQRDSISAQAAFNWLILSYDLQLFEAIIESKDLILDLSLREKQNLTYYFLGQAYFSKKEYANALAYLRQATSDHKGLTDLQHKRALLAATASAYHNQKVHLVEELCTSYKSLFQEDENTPKLLFLLALAKKEHLDFDKALDILGKIFQQYPEFNQSDHVIFEYNSILSKQKEWQESHKGFWNLIRKYPQSRFQKDALRHCINISLSQINAIKDPENIPSFLNEQLAFDIKSALQKGNILTQKEDKSYRLKLAQILYDLGKYTEAIAFLQDYLKRFEQGQEKTQAHLLLSLCYKAQNNTNSEFAFHAQQVIDLNPHDEKNSELHLNLFNHYLKQAQDIEKKENQDPTYQEQKYKTLEISADHLYQAFLKKENEIQESNLLWLAHFYYLPLAQHMTTHWQKKLEDPSLREKGQRSERILESLLLKNQSLVNSLSLRKSSLENEVLKLGKIWMWQGKTDKQIALLENLNQLQNTKNKWPWKKKLHCLFDLAQAYEKEKEKEKALVTYQNLLNRAQSPQAYMTNYAKLHYARLAFDQLKEEEKQENHPEMMRIFSMLKDLVVQKSANLGAIPIEAALEYAEIRASLEKQKMQTEKLLFLLHRIKEGFSQEKALLQNPKDTPLFSKQRKLYQAYMIFLDARISQIEAIVAQRSGKNQEQISKSRAAQALFSSLLEGNFALTEYLFHQTHKNLNLTLETQ